MINSLKHRNHRKSQKLTTLCRNFSRTNDQTLSSLNEDRLQLDTDGTLIGGSSDCKACRRNAGYKAVTTLIFGIWPHTRPSLTVLSHPDSILSLQVSVPACFCSENYKSGVNSSVSTTPTDKKCDQ